MHCEKDLSKFRPRKVDFLETSRTSLRREKYNFIWSTVRIKRLNRSKSKSLNEIAMKPTTNVNFTKKSAHLPCCIQSL